MLYGTLMGRSGMCTRSAMCQQLTAEIPNVHPNPVAIFGTLDAQCAPLSLLLFFSWAYVSRLGRIGSTSQSST